MSKNHIVFISQVLLNCNCERIFSILTRPKIFPKFIKGIQEIKSIKDHLNNKGDSYFESRYIYGIESWSEIFVSVIDAPNCIAYSSRFKNITATYIYNMQANESGCVLILKVYTRADNIFGEILIPIINSTIRKMDSNQLFYLKELLNYNI